MTIQPYAGVGNLLFTDNRRQIREKLGISFKADVKGYNPIEPNDYFEDIGLFVFYDSQDNVKAFEFYESGPVFNDIDLLTIKYQNLVDLFAEIDPELETDYNSFTSYKYGIGGSTNDDPESDEAMPQSIIIFEKDYYSSL